MEMAELAQKIETGFEDLKKDSAEDRGVLRELGRNVQDLTARIAVVEDRFNNGLPTKALCQTLHSGLEKDISDVEKRTERECAEAKALAHAVSGRMWIFLGGLTVTAIASIGGLIAALAALGGHATP